MIEEKENIKHIKDVTTQVATPKITQVEYNKIIKLGKKGGLWAEILAGLDMDREQARWKHNEEMPEYDSLFCKAIRMATIYAEAQWIKNRNKENPSIWMAVMKHSFSWDGKRSNVTRDTTDSKGMMEEVVKRVFLGEWSVSEGKDMVAMLAQVYEVKEISPLLEKVEKQMLKDD